MTQQSKYTCFEKNLLILFINLYRMLISYTFPLFCYLPKLYSYNLMWINTKTETLGDITLFTVIWRWYLLLFLWENRKKILVYWLAPGNSSRSQEYYLLFVFTIFFLFAFNCILLVTFINTMVEIIMNLRYTTLNNTMLYSEGFSHPRRKS